jgi:hypothetical protein
MPELIPILKEKKNTMFNEMKELKESLISKGGKK